MYLSAIFLLFTNLARFGTCLHVRDWNPTNSSLTCLFLTSEADWMGEMQNLCEVGGACAQLPDGLTANVSSAGPTEGQTCFLYSEANCMGARSVPIVNPGNANLSEVGFDKQAVSWRCWKMCGYKVGMSSSAGVSTTTTMASSALPDVSNSTIQPNVSVTFTFSPSAATVKAVQEVDTTSSQEQASITTTVSKSTSASSQRSITTTLTGSQSVIEIQSTTFSVVATPATPTSVNSTTFSSVETPTKLPTPTSVDSTSFRPADGVSRMPTSVISTAFSTVETSVMPTPTSVDSTSFIPASSGSSASTSSIDTNTPGFSMSPSPVTLTHTFADGSTGTTTVDVIQPVPTLPTEPVML